MRALFPAFLIALLVTSCAAGNRFYHVWMVQETYDGVTLPSRLCVALGYWC